MLFCLQGHLISSQLFVFLWFLFLCDTANCINTIRYVKFERLMCEVEFWEVFFERYKAFFCVVCYRFHVLTAE
jgi:hypothetical protein